MRVIKVLNTSVVLALDDNGREVILMGKGIGFKKKIGSTLNESEIEKVFVLKDRSLSRSIIRLATSINADVFEMAKDSIDYAKEVYHMNLMDHIYLALTDHLAFAIERTRSGVNIPGFYSHEVRRFNPDEYAVALYTLRLVKERTQVELPNGELSNIAFHFINAQRENPLNQEHLRIEELVNGALDIVKYTFGISYDTDSISYSRFLTHLQAFAQRLVLRQQLPEESNNFLYEEVERNYPRELACAIRIGVFTQNRYSFSLTNQELLYLTIHIRRILEEHPSPQKESIQKT